MTQHNKFGQPVGDDLVNWTPHKAPPHKELAGRYARLAPLSLAHADDLFDAFAADETGAMWTYMPVGPFSNSADWNAWLQNTVKSRDPQFYAIINQATGTSLGFASFLRIDPANGAIEVGFIAMSPALQKTRAATEAMFLMMAHIFDDLGYRRYEWKCDALNAPSRKAAARFGFQFEGIFRQAVVYKGRNRDTAWFSICDHEWPAIKARFVAWLDPANFDENGQQRVQLQSH